MSAARLVTTGLSLALIGRTAWAQDVGTPQPSTVPQPQIVGPTPVNGAAPPTAPNGMQPGDLFTLNRPLAGPGTTLANAGIFLKGFYEGTDYGVVSGGLERADIFYNEAYYGADLNLEKMLGMTGTVVHLTLDSRFGGIPQGVNDLTGSALGNLQGAGPDNKTRLNEFTWDQHLLGDKIRFVVGRTTLANYFGGEFLYCQFQPSICSNLQPFNWSADSNNPFWPIATWAGEIGFFPTSTLYLRTGASEENPSQYDHAGFPWDAQWGTRNATGFFLPVEFGYQTDAFKTRYNAHYDVGFYYDSSTFTDPRYNTSGQRLTEDGGVPGTEGRSAVVYGQVDQVIYRPDAHKPQNVTLSLGAQFTVSGHALVQSYYQVALIAHGTFPSRPSDSAGLLLTQSLLNHRVVGALDDRIAAEGLSGNISATEEIAELNYGFEFAPGVQIKPYIDYTWHPDQSLFDVATVNPDVHHAVAVGSQLSILLNDALGLPSFFRDN